jgi:hypothetical protein
MSIRTSRLRAELDALLVEQQAVVSELRDRAADTSQSVRSIASLLDRSGDLQRRMHRIVDALRKQELSDAIYPAPSFKGLTGDPTIRETVAQVLHIVGVPLPARLVSELAAVLLDRQAPAARLASIRRDEERAFRRRPTARPEWIVPALNSINLAAMPRLIALSSWEPERRLVGPRSGHVNQLRAVLALIQQAERRSWTPAQQQRLLALIRRLAAPLPGANQTASAVSLDKIAEAAREEIELIEPDDNHDRAQAARLLLNVEPHGQLWGRALDDLEGEFTAGIRRISG